MSDQGFGDQPPQGQYPPPSAQPPQGEYPPPQPPQDQYPPGYGQPAAPPYGAPTVPKKKRSGLIIGLAVALVILCGLGACAAAIVGLGVYGSRSETYSSAEKSVELKPIVVDVDKIREDAAEKMDEAEKLVDAKKFDAAYDAYFAIAETAKEDSQTVGQALTAVAAAFDEQMGESRLSKQLDQALVLYARFPEGRRPQAMDDYILGYLTEPVLAEAREGKLYLDDRRKFIKAIRDDGKGNVYMTPKKDRLLTEAEVVDAQSHLQALSVSGDVVKLYEYARPMAAAMDRFFADDSRYLGKATVSSADLNALGSSCDALDKTLVPVQRQLDRVRPGWR